MRRVMVRYKVKPDRVEENERYVREVFKALARSKPENVRYATLKLADGVSFVHIAMYEVADGANPLTSLPEFKAFTAGVKERCDMPPESVEWSAVGSYGLW
jgi:hypothetical protein